MNDTKPIVIHVGDGAGHANGFGGTQPTRVHVDMDKYIDQRVAAGFSDRENKIWRTLWGTLWKWLLLTAGGGGVIGFLLNLLFQ